jgi:hypothetical protein
MAPGNPPAPKNPRYRFSTPLVHDDGSAIPPEWGLRCPACDYDLTGLSARRCPECGRRFDPHDIWVANKHKQSGVGRPTPAYVIYGALIIGLMIVVPLIDNPLSLLPLGILPAYELGAFFLNRRAAPSRPIIVALAIIACIVVAAW